MTTFKQFLIEAISKDSFEGNLPQSEFKRIGRRLAQYGVNFDKLTFKRAEPNQFKISPIVTGWFKSYRFSKLPTEYTEADMELRRATKRRMITLVSVNPTDHSYAVFVIWGTKSDQSRWIQSSDRKFDPSMDKTIFNDNSKARTFLHNEDVINYYAFTSPVDVQEFKKQRKDQVKFYESRIKALIKDSSYYKKLNAFCKKYDLKINMFHLNGEHKPVDDDTVPFDVFDKTWNKNRAHWIVELASPKNAKKDVNIDYDKDSHYMIMMYICSRDKNEKNNQWYCTYGEKLNDESERKKRNSHIKQDPDNKQYYENVYQLRKLVSDRLLDFEPDLVKLMNDLQDFVDEQGFNIN